MIYFSVYINFYKFLPAMFFIAFNTQVFHFFIKSFPEHFNPFKVILTAIILIELLDFSFLVYRNVIYIDLVSCCFLKFGSRI